MNSFQDKHEILERPVKKQKTPSILSVFSLLFFRIIETIIQLLDYDERESIPILPRFSLAIFFGLLISLFFDFMRNYEETAKRNRAYIREAEVISTFWKVKTLLFLQCDLSWPVTQVTMFHNLLCIYSKEYGNIPALFGIALLIFTIFQVYCRGGICFAELYLDLEYVEERRLTDEKALKEELKEIWKNKVTFKTEYRED